MDVYPVVFSHIHAKTRECFPFRKIRVIDEYRILNVEVLCRSIQNVRHRVIVSSPYRKRLFVVAERGTPYLVDCRFTLYTGLCGCVLEYLIFSVYCDESILDVFE